MLEKIKRSLFRIINDSAEELGVASNTDNFDIEFTSLGSLWLFRYDCIVSADYP